MYDIFFILTHLLKKIIILFGLYKTKPELPAYFPRNSVGVRPVIRLNMRVKWWGNVFHNRSKNTKKHHCY